MPIAGKYRGISKITQPQIRSQIASSLRGQRPQLTRALAKLHHIVEEIEDDLSPDALEAVLILMQNLAKNPARPGAWIDRTGNLRDSIVYVILKPRSIKTVDYEHGTAQAKNTTNQLIGLILAGMEYGASLEKKTGYSVLGYPVEALKKRVTPTLARKLRINRLQIPDID